MSANDRATKAPRRWLWWAIPAAVVVALIVVAVAQSQTVEVDTARQGDLVITVTATGDVEGRVADVSPTLQGRVEAVYREEGDWVQRGDLLCRITPAPGLPAESATLTSHESITAPFDGIVSRRHVDPGDAAIPGSPLFQVADPSEVWIVALIDDIDIGRISKGMSAEVSLPAYMSETIAATITEVGAIATPRTAIGTGGKVVRTRLELDQPTTTLRPGMEVDVRVETVAARDVALVPTDAIVERDAKRSIFVVRDGRARETVVEVGANNYLDAEIRSGVSSGDVVVVGGKTDLRDGQRVRTTEVSEQ